MGSNRALSVGSLFSGIGGMDTGLEMAGMRVNWQVEINRYCRSVLRSHYPMTYIFNDVRKLVDDEKFNSLPKVDLICGGDPCQENSNARQCEHLTQPSLGEDFIRIIRHVRPSYVLRENPSQVRKDAPWPWWRFRSRLEEIGYGVVPFRLRTCCLGGKHRRDRLYLFASLPNATGKRLSWSKERVERVEEAREWVQLQPERLSRGNPTPRVLRGVTEVTNWKERVKALGNSVDVGQAYYIGRMIQTWIDLK